MRNPNMFRIGIVRIIPRMNFCVSGSISLRVAVGASKNWKKLVLFGSSMTKPYLRGFRTPIDGKFDVKASAKLVILYIFIIVIIYLIVKACIQTALVPWRANRFNYHLTCL